MTNHELDQLCINAIRFLAVDMVQKANSGHPGLPLDAAPMAYTLWTRYLRFNPHDPYWFNRDRFVLSAGHGSAMLYALLYLTGYDVSLDEIRRFRQWGSITPGHPESGLTPGVEVTTGPLGQGFGNGVGMAIAEAHLAARYNRPGFEIIDHRTYAIASDGDMMEGIASEAASLAGHLNLGKLTYLYDSNHISLASSTGVTFTEDTAARFESYGWYVQRVEDGNDLAAIDGALRAAPRLRAAQCGNPGGGQGLPPGPAAVRTAIAHRLCAQRELRGGHAHGIVLAAGRHGGVLRHQPASGQAAVGNAPPGSGRLPVRRAGGAGS